MFSLIITIIAVMLVAALAVATIYYGGAGFNKSDLSAQVTRRVNEAQQIKGAAALYLVENSSVSTFTLEDLVNNNYLSAAPANWASVAQDVAGVTVDNLDVCNAINASLNNAYAGSTTPPDCSALTAGQEACCVNP